MLTLLIVLSLVFGGSAKGKYNSYEEAEWKLVGKQPEDNSYEVRYYPAANWTSTTMEGINSDAVSKYSFWRLFSYIQGSNGQGVNIDMTVPVTIRMRTPNCIFCNSSFTMSFYEPKLHQADPPKPTNPQVVIEQRPSMTVYVRRFSGYAYSDDWRREVVALFEDLKRNKVSTDTLDMTSYMAVGYDSPFRFIRRRNEVWIISKQDM